MLNEGNQIHNFISSSGSDFLTSYGFGSGSTMQKVTVPTVPVPVPKQWTQETKFLSVSNEALPVMQENKPTRPKKTGYITLAVTRGSNCGPWHFRRRPAQ